MIIARHEGRHPRTALQVLACVCVYAFLQRSRCVVVMHGCCRYLGGVIEGVAAKVGATPNISSAQLQSRVGRMAASTGGALGIFVGCLLGMFPLLFMDHDERKLTKLFADEDADNDGLIDMEGVKRVLKLSGMHISSVRLGEREKQRKR